jgi:Protein of unknown function (DUF2817)
MNVSTHFAADYAEARRKFRDAATAAGARLTQYRNAARGPAGEELTTEVARLGPQNAGKVLMTISATHGGEGFCGSGIQVASFAAGFGRDLPPDTAMVVVHAINPYGFAWIRRVTEENVDLNRNFVRHDRPLPTNKAYDELHDAICPREWTDASIAASRARFDAYAKEHGAAALQRALSGGQYNHPDGVFYGGDASTWARRTLEEIIGTQTLGARHLAIIDYHTGLGPWGYGEQIVIHAPGSAAESRAAQWYGKIANPAAGTSSSAILHGTNLDGIEAALATRGVAFTGMALEYGTLPLQVVLDAVRADNWLHQHGDVNSAKGRELKRAARDAFYGDKDDWKEMVFEQGIEAQRRALTGLQG